MQLGLQICSETRFLTCSMSPRLAASLTLAMIPARVQIRHEHESSSAYNAQTLPGRSTKDRSGTSGPVICSEMQLREKPDCSTSSSSESSMSKKVSESLDGQRIANWARRRRSSTSFLSVMTFPNGLFCTGWIGLPSLSSMKRSATVHFHCPAVCESLHSVGQLVALSVRDARRSVHSPGACAARPRKADACEDVSWRATNQSPAHQRCSR